jgi:hypothetical protein
MIFITLDVPEFLDTCTVPGPTVQCGMSQGGHVGSHPACNSSSASPRVGQLHRFIWFGERATVRMAVTGDVLSPGYRFTSVAAAGSFAPPRMTPNWEEFGEHTKPGVNQGVPDGARKSSMTMPPTGAACTLNQ